MTKRVIVRLGALLSGLAAVMLSGGAGWSIK